MGDRVHATITIGGELPRADLEGLLAAIQAERLGWDWHYSFVEHDYEVLMRVGEPLVLMASEVNYGNLDEITDFCVTHDLPYRRTWGQGYEFPAGGESWSPISGYLEFPTVDDKPAVTAVELRALASWEAILEHLDAIERPVPPFTVKEA